jgi:hypothetical protein
MFQRKCTNRKGGVPLSMLGYVETSTTRSVIIS